MSETAHMNASIATRLSAAKQLYLEGDSIRSRADDAGRVQAALLLDLAVETGLKTVLAHHAVPLKTFLSFPKLLELVAPHAPNAGTFSAHHAVRNAAQHDGTPPRPEQLDALALAARGVLEEAFRACGADFARFNLVPLVGNPTTSKLLVAADDQIETDSHTSVVLSDRALAWIRHMAKYLAAEAHNVDTWEEFDPISGYRSITANADGRGETTAKLLDGLVSVGLGFELGEHLRHVRLARADGPTTEEAIWVVDYVARHAYRLEQALPDMVSMAPETTGPTAAVASILPRKVFLATNRKRT